MHKLITLVFITTCIFCSGCYASMTGKVVDAETGKPIEGAILLVEWIKGHGIGLTSHTSAKAVEVFSDKEGLVTIPGYLNPFVEGPDITIYKPGYVAWNNHWIFPDTRNRNDFKWKDDFVFRLDKFKGGDSYIDHGGFVNMCINRSLTKTNKETFIKIFEEYELDKRVIERKPGIERH